MEENHLKNLLIGLFFLAPVFLSLPSHATLGGNEDSVEADRAAFFGQRSVVAHGNYQVHVILTSGQSVKEYVTPSGMVFGVAWRGATQPDLSQLFGNYYKEFKTASDKSKHKGRGHREVASEHLKVVFSGHMRDVRGTAYIPKLLPAGMTAQDIQW